MKNFNKYFDHTLLKPDASQKDIKKLCHEALKYDFASVCVNGCHVFTAAEQLKGSTVKVAAVTGFPLGAMTSASKLAETKDALFNGADEIDTVINIGALKDDRYVYIEQELSALAELCHRHNALLKVIVEACLLNDDEIVAACRLAKKAGADFVKTSTGFSTGGASEDTVRLMKNIVDSRESGVMVKASGGIRTLKDAIKMIEAGADRLGCSASVSIMEEYLRNKK